jgi:hypothetical protein
MKRKLYLFIIPILLITGCKTGRYETWQNDSIDAAIKQNISKLDEEILISIDTDNPDKLKLVVSEGFLNASKNDLPNITKQFCDIIEHDNYSILDQYYVENTTSGLSNTLISGLDGDNNYILKYLALNEEMFTSVLLTNRGIDKFMVLNIYGKYPDGWKLNILQIGQYTANGKTAPELYQEAKNLKEKGYIIDAAINMYLCMQVLYPGGSYWQYNTEQEMKDFYDEVVNENSNTYQFPIVIDNIPSKPEIQYIEPISFFDEGTFPVIHYLTKIPLEDTAKLSVENDNIHTLIGEYFNGIDLNKKYIIYKAWNKLPEGVQPETSYGFVKEL